MGALSSAPLLLLRCPEERVAQLLRAMDRWPEVAHVESIQPEPLDLEFDAAEPGRREEAGVPAVGFADLGRPDLADPRLAQRLPGDGRGAALSVHGVEHCADHPGAVFAAFLDALPAALRPPCIFESLRADCGPFSWLAAMDRLIGRGARILNLSYGRRAVEAQEGWGPLAWGTQLLCHLRHALVVAAAGQPSDSIPRGFHLYLPANVPEVIAADGEGRWWGSAGETDEDKIFLASRVDPFGGAPGSSFAAPRITAMVSEILNSLPEDQWTPQGVGGLLLLASRPAPPSIPAAGAPDPATLRRILHEGPGRRTGVIP